MKIIVMSAADFRIDILDVPEDMLADENGAETFLAEHGYSLNNIDWMAAPADYLPVGFHSYSQNELQEELCTSMEGLMFGQVERH